MFRRGWASFIFLFLSACGGGGGGGNPDGGNNNSSAPALTFTPGKVTLTFYPGESVAFDVNASASQSITGSVYVFVVDSQGVITSDVKITTNSTYSYTATLHTSPLLTAGHHTGNLSVRLCKDSSCSAQWPGSPVSLPYDFDVQSPYAIEPSVSPSSISAAFSSGDHDSARVLTASYAQNSSRPVYVRATDDAAILHGETATNPMSGSSTNISLTTDAPAGHYTGTLKVSFCLDSDCMSPFADSPVLVPYDIQVYNQFNLSTLTLWSGVPEWETLQGNASHNGYVPVTLDPDKFTPRWQWDAVGMLTSAVTANGKVYITGSDASSGYSLFALNESDMSLAWRHDFPTSFNTSIYRTAPATSGGKVFVDVWGFDANNYDTRYLWSFDNANGTTVYKKSMGSQTMHYLAPTTVNGIVYTGDVNGSMCQFDATGTGTWCAYLANVDGWTPAVDANYAYANVDGKITVANLLDGSQAYSIAFPYFLYGYSTDSAPVLGTSGSLISIGGPQGHLAGFDLNSQSVKWDIDGAYAATPTVANGVVYALNESTLSLEARRESDGALLWTWVPPGSNTTLVGGSIIATDNTLLVSVGNHTYAISLAPTHYVLWSSSHGGQLTLSPSGILYIASNTTLYAINVK